MAKQSIVGRISQLLKANINALIDQAEDPQLMLDQLVRDFSNSITEADTAVAQTIGNLRMMEQDHAEDVAESADWGRKALAASTKADELRGAGDTANADRFDALAKVAIGKQLAAEAAAAALAPTIASQNEIVERLKAGLTGMRGKLDELIAKRDELVARAKAAEAQQKVADSIRSIDVFDPTSDLGRFEEKVRREEAKVIGQQELAASTLDSQFEALDDLGQQLEVDNRLAALKAGTAPKAVTAGD